MLDSPAPLVVAARRPTLLGRGASIHSHLAQVPVRHVHTNRGIDSDPRTASCGLGRRWALQRIVGSPGREWSCIEICPVYIELVLHCNSLRTHIACQSGSQAAVLVAVAEVVRRRCSSSPWVEYPLSNMPLTLSRAFCSASSGARSFRTNSIEMPAKGTPSRSGLSCHS